MLCEEFGESGWNRSFQHNLPINSMAMVKNQGSQKQKCMIVTIRHVATPDSNARLSGAIATLLKAAARSTSQSKGISNGKQETPHGQAHN